MNWQEKVTKYFESDPLDKLFIQVDTRQFLGHLLLPYVRLEVDEYGAIEDCKITFLGDYSDLKQRERILLWLYIRMAIQERGNYHQKELPISAYDLEQWCGIVGNTLRPLLRQLLDKGLVRENDRKRYYVDTTTLLKLYNMVGKKWFKHVKHDAS